jgi:hypothetical protein
MKEFQNQSEDSSEEKTEFDSPRLVDLYSSSLFIHSQISHCVIIQVFAHLLLYRYKDNAEMLHVCAVLPGNNSPRPE